MSIRYDWQSASKEAAAIELAKRGFSRELYKDTHLVCLVCGKKPREKEWVYYPARGTSQANRIIAHKDECDRIYAKALATDAGQQKRDVIRPVAAAHEKQPQEVVTPAAPKNGKVESGALAELERLRGREEGFLTYQRLLQETTPERLRGWLEGVRQAFELAEQVRA